MKSICLLVLVTAVAMSTNAEIISRSSSCSFQRICDSDHAALVLTEMDRITLGPLSVSIRLDLLNLLRNVKQCYRPCWQETCGVSDPSEIADRMCAGEREERNRRCDEYERRYFQCTNRYRVTSRDWLLSVSVGCDRVLSIGK